MPIPRILFTYWEGDNFSYLHYLTIVSLHKYNPHLNIIVYTSARPSNKLVDWSTGEHSIDIINKYDFNSISHISDKITIKEIDFKMIYDIDDNISCVHKADFVRIAKLYEHGGLWFDFDILFIRPIPEYMFSDKYDVICFSYEYTIPTGIISSSPNNLLLESLLLNVKDKIKMFDNDYQKIGPNLWRDCYINDKSTSKIIANTTDIYPYLWQDIQLFFESNYDKISENTWGIHWYNGSACAKKYINNILSNITKDLVINKYIIKFV